MFGQLPCIESKKVKMVKKIVGAFTRLVTSREICVCSFSFSLSSCYGVQKKGAAIKKTSVMDKGIIYFYGRVWVWFWFLVFICSRSRDIVEDGMCKTLNTNILFIFSIHSDDEFTNPSQLPIMSLNHWWWIVWPQSVIPFLFKKIMELCIMSFISQWVL